MSKAIFLDRDGTLNIDYDHVFQIERIKLIDGVSESISLLRKSGFKIFIISNQSCVGRGYAKIEEVEACMAKVSELMTEEYSDAKIDEAYFAPDHPDKATERRKPKAGMLLEAIQKYNLDISKCWMVGDRLSDPMAGKNAGLDPSRCVLVETDGIEGRISNDVKEKASKEGFLFYKDLKTLTPHILGK